MKSFSRPQVELHLGSSKEIFGQNYWLSRSNHLGRKVLTAPLADGNGITIPGLTMHLEVRAPVIADACLFLFALFQRGTTNPPRMYQLEVCPARKLSHNAATGQIFGPHEHVGDHVNGLHLEGLNCGDWKSAFEWFLKRTNVSENLLYYTPEP